jgi:hypothetical protein
MISGAVNIRNRLAPQLNLSLSRVWKNILTQWNLILSLLASSILKNPGASCCSMSVLWSIVLNHCLILQLNLRPKWSWLEPSDRKCKGRSTERRIAKLKEKAEEIDENHRKSIKS